MSQDFARYNDGSQAPPRLRLDHSLWSLGRLPMNAPQEWTLQEKFQRVKAAGFESVMCRPDDDNESELIGALRAAGLGFVMAESTGEVAQVQRAVERAARLGADFIFLQPANAFAALDDVVHLVREGRRIANDAGLAFFVETHRNYFTENLPQTLQLIERVPEIRITADLSHLVLVGEFYGWPDEGAAQRMMPLLERTSHIHGRVSDGESIQVDVGDGSGQAAQFFVELWTIAMRHWLDGAGAGDVFPFASELGPPRYSQTLPDGREISDRWEQSLIMKQLAEQAWKNAGGPWPG